MITEKEVAQAIEECMREPVTGNKRAVLADLIIIQDYLFGEPTLAQEAPQPIPMQSYSAPPVEQVEVSNKNVKLRVVLFVLFLVLAIVCFAVVMVVLLRVEAGWFAITTDPSSTKNCGGEFVFTYYFDKNQDKNYRQSVASKYTEASEYAYKVFYASEEVDGMNNLFYLKREQIVLK